MNKQRHVIVALVSVLAAASQEKPALQTEYHFRLSPRGPELTFRVALDADRVPVSVSVFKPGEALPFQTLANCALSSKESFPSDRYPELELLKAADLDFDGYLDVQLVAYANMPHLGNTFYCVWLWDQVAQSFRSVPELSEVADPTPDAATRTIRSHRYYMGGPEVDEIYAWENREPVLTESRRLYYGSSVPGCNHYSVEKRVGGQIVQVSDTLVEPGLRELVPCRAGRPVADLRSHIGTGLPEYTFRPILDAESGVVNEVQVYRGGGENPVQRLKECDVGEAPPKAGKWMLTDDLNFDGYRDLLLLKFHGATGNLGYCVWLFDPASNTFEYVREFTLGAYSLKAASKTVTAVWNGGFAGKIYNKSEMQFVGGRPLVVAEERQEWDPIKCAFRAEWRKRVNDKLVLFKRQWSAPEPGLPCASAPGPPAPQNFGLSVRPVQGDAPGA